MSETIPTDMICGQFRLPATTFLIRRIIFIAIICCMHASYSQSVFSGTTLAVVRTKDTILIAADSKETEMSTPLAIVWDPTPQYFSRQLEKIRVVGDVAFSVGGFYSLGLIGSSWSADYDVFRVAEDACSTNGDIFFIAGCAEHALTQAIEHGWRELQTTYPFVHLNAYPVYFILGGFYHERPYVFIDIFRPKKLTLHITNSPSRVSLFNDSVWSKAFPSMAMSPTTTIPVYSATPALETIQFPVEGRPADSTYRAIFNEVIPSSSFSKLDSLAITDPMSYVRKAISTAISVDALRNGPPIRILCITRRGMNWIPND